MHRCWSTLDCFVCIKYWNYLLWHIFRIQANNSIMCGYFCTELNNFMPAGKTLIDYTRLH